MATQLHRSVGVNISCEVMQMGSLSKLFSITAASALILVASAAPASADVLVSFGVNNQDTDNVLLNPATDAFTVTGTFGTSDRVVEFTSMSGSNLLTANPSGQATVTGGTGNDPLTEITFGVEADAFTRAVFNINALTDGDALITVQGYNIEGGFFAQAFNVDANGQNFFTVDAINGQSITSISLLGINGATFQDIRQVRLGGQGDINSTPVPEPASMLLLGTGLTAMVAARRRRQQRAQGCSLSADN